MKALILTVAHFFPLSLAQNLTGKYSVKGTNSNSTSYKCTVVIKGKGYLWRVDWDCNGSPYWGTGLLNKGILSVAYESGVVSYEVRPNGDLDGIWTILGGTKVMQEYATRLR